jgi:hypothetical protein
MVKKVSNQTSRCTGNGFRTVQQAINCLPVFIQVLSLNVAQTKVYCGLPRINRLSVDNQQHISALSPLP